MSVKRWRAWNILNSITLCDTIDEMEQVLRKILTELLERYQIKDSSKSSHEQMQQILAFIEKSCGDCNLSLNMLSDQFGISVSYLSKLFKEHTGNNFLTWLIKLRMEKAKKLLTESNMKVNEIALKTGYPNISSFLRIFKKYYHCTPTELRSASKKKKD